jgi:Mg-chelatase subunit ChlD
MTAKRNRRKHVKGTTERLLESATEARAQAALLPPGRLQRELLRKAREAETTAHLNDWLTSPGLRPPK